MKNVWYFVFWLTPTHMYMQTTSGLNAPKNGQGINSSWLQHLTSLSLGLWKPAHRILPYLFGTRGIIWVCLKMWCTATNCNVEYVDSKTGLGFSHNFTQTHAILLGCIHYVQYPISIPSNFAIASTFSFSIIINSQFGGFCSISKHKLIMIIKYDNYDNGDSTVFKNQIENRISYMILDVDNATNQMIIGWVEEMLHHQKDGWHPINHGIKINHDKPW